MQGSLSVEAALSLSLFLFFYFRLIMPTKMLDRRRQVQAVMGPVRKELSQYAYMEYCFRSAEEEGVEVDVGRAEDIVTSVLATVHASVGILGEINREWMGAVPSEETDIGEDEMIHTVMKYRIRLPFSVSGVSSIPAEQTCSRRMWNGADGGRLGGGDRDGNGEEDEIVYIGRSSTRYHHLRTCHYLYNDLEAVDLGAVGKLRNEARGRYSSRGTCGGGSGSTGSGGTKSGSMGSSDTVYVVPYGSSYHVSKSCRSIIAYVQVVPLTQMEYLGECSYCRGKWYGRRGCYLLDISNGGLTEQLTARYDTTGILLCCGFLMMLLIGAWQGMRNHRIKLSPIMMSAVAGAVLRCTCTVPDVAIIYRDSGYKVSSDLVSGQIIDTAMVVIVEAGLLFLSRITSEAMERGDGRFSLILGTYLGTLKNLVLLTDGLGICFLLSMVLVFKGIIQGIDRGRLRIPLLPLLIPAGIGVMLL